LASKIIKLHWRENSGRPKENILEIFANMIFEESLSLEMKLL
jgi:hypothetical protein